MKSTIARLTVAIGTALMLTVGASALERPAGDVVLTVRGAITQKNAGEAAEFDPAMLRALPGRDATLQTPWTEGETGFSGPGSRLIIRALNDYAPEVPVIDAVDFDTILAIDMNGEPMTVRNKGPLFLIYPFDTNPDLYNEKYFSRSVWQIKEIVVVE